MITESLELAESSQSWWERLAVSFISLYFIFKLILGNIYIYFIFGLYNRFGSWVTRDGNFQFFKHDNLTFVIQSASYI